MNPDPFLGKLFSLKGRVAVVIGGTGELCGEIAAGFAAAGAEVVLVGRDGEKAKRRLEGISAAGGRGCFGGVSPSSASFCCMAAGSTQPRRPARRT